LTAHTGTSGLDSHSAFSVISTLQQISRLNVAVLCTIHQPSFEIFSKFDRVILMAQGRIAFHGTIPEAVAHFEKLGYPLPAGANAADHFIALLTEPGNKEGVSEEEKERVKHFLDVWSEIQEGRGSEAEQEKPAEECIAHVGDSAIDSEELERRGFGLGYIQELYWLTKRLVLFPTFTRTPGFIFRTTKVLTNHYLQSMDPTSPLSCELHCRDRTIHLHVHRLRLYLLSPRILAGRCPWPSGSTLLYPHPKHFRSTVPYYHFRADEYWPSHERA
jgi:hypothetical protein